VRKLEIIKNYTDYLTDDSSDATGPCSMTTKTTAKFELRGAKKRGWTLPFLLVLGFSCVCSTVWASVEITDLGTLGGGWSDAYGINDSGQITGTFEAPDGAGHTYLYQNGQTSDLFPLSGLVSEPTGINNFGQIASGVIAQDGIYYPAVYDGRTESITVLGSLGGINSSGVSGQALAINNVGQVVGYSYVPSGEWHPFLYNKGVMQDLGCLPNETAPCYAYALGINDIGQVVGGTGSDHAFLYSNGVMAQIEPPNSSGGRAYSINNHGQVVGYYYKANSGRAFLYQNGTFTTIGSSASPYSVAFSINERGQVVGSTWLVDKDRNVYEPRAFVYENGTLINLNDLLPAGSAWKLAYAFGINNAGKIVGTGLLDGHYHAFLLQFGRPSTQLKQHGR
jgi:probable HAF family extracellular repeat protein